MKRKATKVDDLPRSSNLELISNSRKKIKSACLHLQPFLTKIDKLSFELKYRKGNELSPGLRTQIRTILQSNMSKHHVAAAWKAERRLKFQQMVHSTAHYLVLQEIPSEGAIRSLTDEGSHEIASPKRKRVEREGKISGFIHFRFVMEEKLPVIYVYELQLEESVRGKRIGVWMMETVESLGRKMDMKGCVLTVQRSNTAAMAFYIHKLGFEVSPCSPSQVDPQASGSYNYEILCKMFDDESAAFLRKRGRLAQKKI